MFRHISYLPVCLSFLVGGSILAQSVLVSAQQYVPPKRGIPSRRESGGTRGSCIGAGKEFMPLVPTDGFSTSVLDSPTFFWYIPRTVAKTAEFSLLDHHTGVEVYHTTVILNNTPGIIGLRLPASITASLKPGSNYIWQGVILCDSKEPSKNPFVESIFQRIQPNSTLKIQVEQATTVDRPTLYATAGIWQDAIDSLAQQRCDRPQDFTLLNRWITLFKSVQLERYAREPLTTYCKTITRELGPQNQP
jgi:hypothetical protein